VSSARAADQPHLRSEDPRLVPLRKAVYASGDFTVNAFLSVLSFVYATYFLTQIAGLRPELAGAVQLVGRFVDAFSDPLMGRISDRCRWEAGRRRPFFLIGAIPFGAFFALLWVDLAGASQAVLFAYYTAVFVLGSLSMTVVSVPYLALLPEMAIGYDARTSLNTWRNAGAVLGVFAAVAFRPVANALGGGAAGFAAAGVAFGLVLALPWLAIHRVSWERPEFQSRVPHLGFRDSMRLLFGHASFRRLTAMYLCGRVSMDLIGAMLILYFTHYLGRSGDFELMMLLFLSAVLVSLPVWLVLARRFEKATVFMIGTLWWTAGQIVFAAVQPDWPRAIVFAFAPVIALGYAVVDLMPWSMIGEVVDEDELASGERREGIYNGFFMFVRKLAGAAGVAFAMFVLGSLGFAKGETQPPAAIEAIRWIATLVPAAMLLLSAWYARGYPLTRAAHERILVELASREGRRR
jgi:sugar (glycoside-pentoside-hexuronide) transporter